MSESKKVESEKRATEKKVSRRQMIMWTGGLAAAAAVGAGIGYGASGLLNVPAGPATTTTTGTPKPPPSFKPPLSPEVQQNVNSIMKGFVDMHAGDFTYYTKAVYSNALKVRVKDGKVTALESEDLINPNMPMEDKYIPESAIMEGKIQTRAWGTYLGLAAGWLDNPDRVLYPMKRVSKERGTLTGKWVRISWQEALDTVAQKMKETQDKYGNYSIYGFLRNNPFAAWQGCDATSYGNPSTEAGDWTLRTMYGFPVNALGGSALGMSTAFKSKLIVLYGHEATYQQGAGFTSAVGYYFRLAHEKGIPVICIDPRYTMAAEVCADQWIPIRQGTDAAFLLAVANVLFKEDLYDKAYVEKFVESTGFAKWKDYVLGKTAGPDGAMDRTPQWAEPICGIPVATIEAFARLYAKSKPCFWSTGAHVVNKQPGAHNTDRIMITLAAMTGNIGVEGGTDNAGGWHGVIGVGAFNRPSNYPTTVPAVSIGQTPGTKLPTPLGPGGGGARALFFKGHFADAVLLRPQLDAGKISPREYADTIGANPNNSLPNIHMVIEQGSIGTGTGETDTQINRVHKAVAAADFMVAIIESWKHGAAQLADIMLPLCTSMLNWGHPAVSWGMNEALFENSRFTNIRNVMCYQPRMVQRHGESKWLYWILSQLANRLGFGEQYSSEFASLGDDQSRWDSKKLELDQKAYEKWAAEPATQTTLGKAPPSWQDFQKKPWVEFPLPTLVEYIPWSDQIQGGKPFGTESGKIEVYSKFLAKPSEATWEAAKHAGGGIPYGWYISGPIAPMGIWEPYWTWYWTPEEFTKYPIWLSTPHSCHRFYELIDMNPFLGDATNVDRDPLHSGDVYENGALKISVSDAKARGIKDGDKVRIFNDAGQAVLKAVVTSTHSPGYATIYHGRFTVHNSSTNVDANGNPVDVRGGSNTFTYQRKDPTCTFPHDAPVQVERA